MIQVVPVPGGLQYEQFGFTNCAHVPEYRPSSAGGRIRSRSDSTDDEFRGGSRAQWSALCCRTEEDTDVADLYQRRYWYFRANGTRASPRSPMPRRDRVVGRH